MADRIQKSKQLGASQLASYKARFEPLLGQAYQQALGQNLDVSNMLADRGVATLMQGMPAMAGPTLSRPQRQGLMSGALASMRQQGRGQTRQQLAGDLLDVLGTGMERKAMGRGALQQLYGIQQQAADFDTRQKAQKRRAMGRLFTTAFTMGFGGGLGGDGGGDT